MKHGIKTAKGVFLEMLNKHFRDRKSDQIEDEGCFIDAIITNTYARNNK